MRRFFRYLVRVLVLIVVFMASALTAMRFAIHGRQTAIPKLVGLAPLQAERLLVDHGLVLERGDRFFSADVPEGRIMSQAPLPGALVRRGWRVRVAESMGPQRMVIPNLVGGSERAAEINIRRRGLELGSIATATIPGGPVDQIVAQSPPANAVNVSAPKISVLLAAPAEANSFVMPDLTGRSEDDAVKAIVGAGLQVASIASQPLPAATQPPPTGETPPPQPPASPSRTVVRTAPAAGQRVFEGQGIRLEVTR
jgi:eukaryotic-like serine/threonine-protein kinase